MFSRLLNYFLTVFKIFLGIILRLKNLLIMCSMETDLRFNDIIQENARLQPFINLITQARALVEPYDPSLARQVLNLETTEPNGRLLVNATKGTNLCFVYKLHAS